MSSREKIGLKSLVGDIRSFIVGSVVLIPTETQPHLEPRFV